MGPIAMHSFATIAAKAPLICFIFGLFSLDPFSKTKTSLIRLLENNVKNEVTVLSKSDIESVGVL